MATTINWWLLEEEFVSAELEDWLDLWNHRSSPADRLQQPQVHPLARGEAQLTGKVFTRFQLSFCVRNRLIPQPHISWGSWAEYPNVSGSQNWEQM